MNKVPEEFLQVMRRFVESRGFHFPETHTNYGNGGRRHPWSVVRDADRATGNCYLAWCQRNGRKLDLVHNLRKYLSDDRRREFAINDWVVELPWFSHARRYGQVIDIKPCNHSKELYPIVAWQDGTVSYTSADFCELTVQPSNTIQSPFHQLHLLEVSA